MTRRGFLAGCVAGCAGGLQSAAAQQKSELDREVGITTSSLGKHVALRPTAKQFSLFDLPRIMRDSLDMRVIDLNTTTLGESGPAELDRFRELRAVEPPSEVQILLDSHDLEELRVLGYVEDEVDAAASEEVSGLGDGPAP